MNISFRVRSVSQLEGNHNGLPLRIVTLCRGNPLWLPPILYGCPQSFMVALVDYFLRVA